MVFPDVLDQCLDVAADSVDVGVPRTEDARVLTVCTVAVALDYEAVGDLEAALVAVFVLADFPCFARGEVQCALAVWAVWYRV
jgi:hypothetical protein